MASETGSIEIFDLRNLNGAGYGQIGVYVNLGYSPYPENYNPLPSSQFDSYQPDQGFIKNTGLRTPLFTGAFISSPLLKDGEYSYLADSKGYTWLYNTFNAMAVTPFQRELYPPGITQYSAALYGPPPEGSIQVVVNDKNQPQVFAAKDSSGKPVRYCFAGDVHGNSFILGSVDTAYSGDVLSAFQQAVLPLGWTKSIRVLDQDLTIYPGYGDGNRRIYNQFRDNLTNNYFQIAFARDGIGIIRGIPGLALSGGNDHDFILGSHLDEQLYGARGNDFLTGVNGSDQIWGDDGNDILQAGLGRSQLWGGTGQDVFLIQSGQITIEDFSKADGDVIDLRASLVGPRRQRRALQQSLQYQQLGRDVSIISPNTHVLVKDIDLSGLVKGQSLLL